MRKTQQLFIILNYADDFAVAEAVLAHAKLSFDTLGKLLSDIGLIESKSKACPPSQSMFFLGLKLEVAELKFELAKWSKKSVAKKGEVQSILGKLLWVSKTVRFSRVFVSQIIC